MSKPITAADGKMSGKPSFSTIIGKVSQAIQEDPRFDTDKHGQPEGSPGDVEPRCIDLLTPDDNGQMCAVIYTDDGRFVKHCFTFDGETVKLADGDPLPTESTPVWAKAAEVGGYVDGGVVIRAGDSVGHPFRGNQHTAGGAGISEDDHKEMVHDAHANLKAHGVKHPTISEVGRHIKDNHGVTLGENSIRKNMPADVKKVEGGEYHTIHPTADKSHRVFIPINSSEPLDTSDVIYASEGGVVLAADATWSMDKPARFQWMPAGVNTICATHGGMPIELTVVCDQQTTGVVQASLDNWRQRFPKLKPFGCIEHREEESALFPEKFEWQDGDEQGVMCVAAPSELGCRNVNGKIHRSWSPSFFTDADYTKAKERNGMMYFPPGVRGSASNPARVTGVSFSVGSLTNKPAFKNILPVRAKQAEPQPAKLAIAENNQTVTMKLKVQKPFGAHTVVGAVVDVASVDEAIRAVAAGEAVLAPDDTAINAKEAELNKFRETQKQQNDLLLDGAIASARARGAVAPKDDAVRAKAVRWLENGMPIADVVGVINEMPGKAAAQGGLLQRQTTATGDNGLAFNAINAVGADLQNVADEYIRAREPMHKLIGTGKDGIKKSLEISTSTSAMLKANFMPIFAKGGDFLLRDVIRAAGTDVLDPDSQVGTLATGLILMRNLGYLKNKLAFLPYISTDLRNEPALWKQVLRTRYITPPAVLTYVPGIGYTSDATTIAAYNAASGATQTTGTKTLSVPSTTDVDVKIDKHYGVEIKFPTSTLGSTMRNLFAEQQGAQFYSLAEQVTKDFLVTLYGATWTGVKNTLSLGANFGLSAVGGSPGVVGIKNAMTLSKLPDTGRFALLHSIYHDQILNDSNLVTAKAITAVVRQDLSAMESGELPVLYGIKVLESQLSAAKGGALVSPTDGSTIGTVADTIGFAGNSSSMLFVARVPQDYTSVFKDIPSTAAIEIITEPDSGLSIMFVKFVDHGLAEVHARCALMYGFAQGDPRQGILLKP